MSNGQVFDPSIFLSVHHKLGVNDAPNSAIVLFRAFIQSAHAAMLLYQVRIGLSMTQKCTNHATAVDIQMASKSKKFAQTK